MSNPCGEFAEQINAEYDGWTVEYDPITGRKFMRGPSGQLTKNEWMRRLFEKSESVQRETDANNDRRGAIEATKRKKAQHG